MKNKSAATSEIDRSILSARAEGQTYAQIGKALGLTRQGVHARLQALLGAERPRDAMIALLERNNRLLAGLIVRICAVQTTRASYPIEVLTGLGLSAREIAEAIGSTEATVNVTKTRARSKKAAMSAEVIQ